MTNIYIYFYSISNEMKRLKRRSDSLIPIFTWIIILKQQLSQCYSVTPAKEWSTKNKKKQSGKTEQQRVRWNRDKVFSWLVMERVVFVLFSCLLNWRSPVQIWNKHKHTHKHRHAHTPTHKDLKTPAKSWKRKNVTNYISFQAIERVNTKEETCIFIAGHSGIDLAVENPPEWASEARREEAFDTTNWWLLERQTGRQIQRSSMSATKKAAC